MFFLLRRAFQKALLPLFFCIAVLSLIGLSAKPSCADTTTVADTVAFSSPPQGTPITGSTVYNPFGQAVASEWNFSTFGNHTISIKAKAGDVIEVNWECSGGYGDLRYDPNAGGITTYTINHAETVTMSADEMTVNIDTEVEAQGNGQVHILDTRAGFLFSWAQTTLTVRNLTTGAIRTSSSYSKQYFCVRHPGDSGPPPSLSDYPPAEQVEYRNGNLVLQTP